MWDQREASRALRDGAAGEIADLSGEKAMVIQGSTHTRRTINYMDSISLVTQANLYRVLCTGEHTMR